MKFCKRCGETKPHSEFTRSKHRPGGLYPSCKACKASAQREFRAANPDLMRSRKLRERHGITLDEYEALLTQQDGQCAICGTTDPGARNFHVDHDHACCNTEPACGSCVRGLLCASCNQGLGMFSDSPDRLISAAVYLSLNANSPATVEDIHQIGQLD